MPFYSKKSESEGRNDTELINIFSSSGDLGVLGELYSRYMHLVYGVCLKYLKDREESKDSVMQIFEKLIDDVPKQKIENFRSWLHVVTRNYCLMKLRSRKTENERLGEWIIETDNIMESGYDLHPIDRDDNERDMDKDLADCIARLKDDQRTCILKFYYENMCYSDIAIALDLDEKKVKSYLQNGKRNLKLCLEEKNERKA